MPRDPEYIYEVEFDRTELVAVRPKHAAMIDEFNRWNEGRPIEIVSLCGAILAVALAGYLNRYPPATMGLAVPSLWGSFFLGLASLWAGSYWFFKTNKSFFSFRRLRERWPAAVCFLFFLLMLSFWAPAIWSFY